MKLLLDTHIWLWGFIEPERLGSRTHKELKNPDNELWLSPVSTWEALTLHAKGRVYLADNLKEWIALNTAPFFEAPLTHEVAVAAGFLSLAHRDPTDRLLAGTAQVFGLTLVTADSRLLGLGEISTLANR